MKRKLWLILFCISLSCLFLPINSYGGSTRKANTHAKRDLYNLYLHCSIHWRRTDWKNNCTPNIASDPKNNYTSGSIDNKKVSTPFVITPGVTITGLGNGKSFTGESSHSDGNKVYRVDNKGKITSEPK